MFELDDECKTTNLKSINDYRNMILVVIFGGLTEERGKRGTMCLRNEIIISAALKWIILPLLCEGRPLTDALNGRRVRQSGEAMMNVEVGESDRLAAPELTTKRRHVDPRHGRRRRRRATANCFRFRVKLLPVHRILLPVLSGTGSGFHMELLPVQKQLLPVYRKLLPVLSGTASGSRCNCFRFREKTASGSE